MVTVHYLLYSLLTPPTDLFRNLYFSQQVKSEAIDTSRFRPHAWSILTRERNWGPSSSELSGQETEQKPEVYFGATPGVSLSCEWPPRVLPFFSIKILSCILSLAIDGQGLVSPSQSHVLMILVLFFLCYSKPKIPHFSSDSFSRNELKSRKCE